VIELAQQAGFVLAATSEINANPLDKADHDKGVWTLPPRLALGEKEIKKYQAIGESDRMTLKFIKPE
jgi:predicted methyltransferase